MEALILTIIATSIPLLLAATGELLAEKSGILNLDLKFHFFQLKVHL